MSHDEESSAAVVDTLMTEDHRLTEYDMVKPSEEAILHCAHCSWSVIEALNTAMGETTLSWKSSAESTIAGVRRVIDNPDETPEQNHEAWMKFKESEGWVYGPNKDPVARTHPCMLPFAALPDLQKAKDAIFTALVHSYFGLMREAQS